MGHYTPSKRVLFAHQSSIPHYRIQFYNTLERMRPRDWCFDVVFDPSSLGTKLYLLDMENTNQFQFPTLDVKTYTWDIANRNICYQTFWVKSGNYDLIIVEDAINNLTYPLSQLHRIRGVRVARWGLGKDRKIDQYSLGTFLIEKFKLLLNRNSDGYFAYTEGVKSYLVENGLQPERIFPVNNTIDINRHRELYERYAIKRESIKSEFNLTDKKVLLFVSTFKKSKKADLLLEAFSILREKDPNYHLLLVGGGGEPYLTGYDKNNLTYFGPIVNPEQLAPIYVASDVFSYPGQVGLAPLQALCYNLPVITIDSHYIHGPEIEYLTSENSLILPMATTPDDYAQAIEDLFSNQERLDYLKAKSWSSIMHLTLDNMARNFIKGINEILESRQN